MRVRFAVDVAAADTAARTIEGTAVPWNEYADLGVGTFAFEPGSLQLARERTPLLLGHNTDAPVGVLKSASSSDDGLVARFRVDRTPDGDAALVQAKSGSRSGLSIGAEITDWTEQDDGSVLVHAADVFEVSLVPVPAFAAATVARVIAQQASPGDGPEGEPEGEDGPPPAANGDEEQPDEEQPDEEQPDDDDQEGSDVHPDQETLASRPQRLPVTRPQRPRVSAGELALAMIRADRGDPEAVKVVRAALATVLTVDTPGLIPPQYTTEILGAIPNPRYLAGLCRRVGLPDFGMKIVKPVWTLLPDGGWVDEITPTPSNKAAVGTQEVDVRQWAYGVQMSYAVATRSSPDYVEAVYREAVNDYYRDVEVLLAGEFAAAAAAAGAAAGSLGAAIAAFFDANQVGPDLLLVSGDVLGDMIDAEGFSKYVTGSVTASGMRGNIAGMDIVASPALAPATIIVTTRGAIEFRESSPVRLTANVIGAMEVEFGVTSFATVDLERPTEFASASALGPAPALASRSKST